MSFSMSFEEARDWALLIVGIIGIMVEAWLLPSPRPVLLTLYAAMVGLPGILTIRRNGKKNDYDS